MGVLLTVSVMLLFAFIISNYIVTKDLKRQLIQLVVIFILNMITKSLLASIWLSFPVMWGYSYYREGMEKRKKKHM